MNIALVAEESAGIKTLSMLLSSGHHIVAVLASESRTRSSSTASVFRAATKCGVPVWPARLVREPSLATQLRTDKVNLLLNVHSLYLIHSDVLEAPSIGAFNLHPGPLPRYAGLNAVSWAIYHGETSHGVTLHKMEPEIDTGPIAYQTFFPITEDDTALSLSHKCLTRGLDLIRMLLDDARADPARIPLKQQDATQRRCYGKRVPDDGRISWQWPADKIVNFVRACDYFPFRSPWGLPLTTCSGIELGIAKARRTRRATDRSPGTVGEIRHSAALVAAADEWVSVEKVKVGTTTRLAGEVLRVGQRLGDITCMSPVSLSRLCDEVVKPAQWRKKYESNLRDVTTR